MAVSLVSEVVAYIAGSDLTMAERMVLLLIAEQANAGTREAWQSTKDGKRWVLAEVVGVGDDGLKSILQRLAKRGLEVRVAIGKDKNEKVMYAVKGRQTTYRLPALPGVSTPPKELYGGVSTPHAGVYTPDGGVSTPPFPSASLLLPKSSSSEPRQIVLKNTDAKPSEADAVVAGIQNENPNLRSLGGFINHLAKAGELQGRVNRVRAARIAAEARENEAADQRARQGLPQCHHGVIGGELPSVNGQIRCKRCRDIRNINERKSA